MGCEILALFIPREGLLGHLSVGQVFEDRLPEAPLGQTHQSVDLVFGDLLPEALLRQFKALFESFDVPE